MDGVQEGHDVVYRLVTTLRDHQQAPAEILARLYHQRWEIETAFDEFKTHLRGRRICLRSKTPELVEQEFYGLMLAHFTVRGLMHEASRKADIDPDTLSFTHSLRVIRRKLPLTPAFPPEQNEEVYARLLDHILEERTVSSRGRINHRGLKRFKQRFPRKRKQFAQHHCCVVVILSRNH